MTLIAVILQSNESHLIKMVLALLTMGFTGGSVGKESACNVRNLGLITGLGTPPGGGHGNPLQYSCLENSNGERSLVGCGPWGCKESDTTGRLSIHTYY